MYETGDGIKQDSFKAAELYQKACDGGNAWGCNNLGFMYHNGDGIIKQDKVKALELYKKSV
ncbi:MAG TPA: sel1 repeat family protein [Epsilonproteobacteria bacterium]|nr:sel1 repeat family protein [Campylobacterota bacterium]